MVTSTPIVDDGLVEVTQITPVDLTAVRDPGMRALVLLAASLGWNVIQKVNNPIALVARDGMQRRLPTNTSVRMSVFQTALSSIILHSGDRVATPALVDAIVAMTKVDRDHERRMRLAIGETAEEHRQRLANEKVAEQKRQPDEHLTQRIEVPTEPEQEPVSFEPPADGRNHGALISRKPFVAHHAVSTKGSKAYVSDSSFERIWQDGFKDYECQICGRIFKAAKGAGSHRQIHIRAGEVEGGTAAWQRSQQFDDPNWTVTHRPETLPPLAIEDLVFEEPPPEHVVETSVGPRGTGLIDEEEDDEMFGEAMAESGEPELIIDRIAALVAPRIMTSRDKWKRIAKHHEATIKALQDELDDKATELQKLRADWDALRGLIDGR